MTRRRRSVLLAVAAAVLGAAGSPASAAVLVRADQIASSVVSHINDDDIVESSGLAYSARHPDLVYTMNDSKNRAIVYAVKVSTGQVVGQTDLDSLDLEDTESIYVDPRGRLWLADLGDNDRERDDVSIVSFDEPGPTSGAPKGLQRFPVSYDRGPQNIEGMLVYPTTGQIFLINKTDGGQATLFALPQQLKNGERNVARDLRRPMPAEVSDAIFTPDGRSALVESSSVITVYDVTTWQSKGEFEVPDLEQAESLTIEPGGRSVLLGSEGEDSPILRMALPSYATSNGAQAAPARPNLGNGSVDQGGAAMPVPPSQPGPTATPARPDLASVATVVAFGGFAAILFGAAALRYLQRHRRLVQRRRRMAERDRG